MSVAFLYLNVFQLILVNPHEQVSKQFSRSSNKHYRMYHIKIHTFAIATYMAICNSKRKIALIESKCTNPF